MEKKNRIVFDDFKNIFSHLSSLTWKNEIDDELIFDIASKNYKNITNGHTKNKNIFRLVGQSGSGKTTQLLPAAKECFSKKNINPICFSVRKFAQLHPKYDELLKEYGKAEIREKTNGFALKCLLVTLILAMSEGYDIIFEVTLLSFEFEKFINLYLDIFDYKMILFCLAVNKEISDYFISKRQQNSLIEGSRKVYKASADFFYDSMEKSLIFLSKESPKRRIIIWNAFDELPKYDGNIESCIEVFKNEQKKTSNNFNDEKKLLDAKIDYLLKEV